jgi:hypothetical protein
MDRLSPGGFYPDKNVGVFLKEKILEIFFIVQDFKATVFIGGYGTQTVMAMA